MVRSWKIGTDSAKSGKHGKELRDPDDVFIHAEERRKELAKQKKRNKKVPRYSLALVQQVSLHYCTC